MPKSDDSDWFRPRGYLHFDAPLSRRHATELAANPTRVASHSFYPLLGYTIKVVKARRDTSRRTIIKIPKDRPIRYAAHADAHIFSYYSSVLSAKYEAALKARGLDNCVLAFRKLEASNIEFAARAFGTIRRLVNCSSLAFDVTGFFDHIDHTLLKRSWSQLLETPSLPTDHYAVFRALTRYSYVDREEVFSALGISVYNPKSGRLRICSAEEFRSQVRNKNLIQVHRESFGIPQGTPISALLSNVYLIEFDAAMNAEAQRLGGEYLRYCDDILITIPRGHDAGLEQYVIDKLAELKLEANPKKTERSCFRGIAGTQICDRPLQYLGFLFDGERVLIRSAALAKFSGRMNQGVRLAKAAAKRRNSERLSQGLPSKGLYKRKLYERYSYLGHRNFISYGYRAANIMNSASIKRQLRPLWGRLKNAIARP